MFDLVLILSRYLFVFYIGYFLMEGARYIAVERGKAKGSMALAASKQRITVIFMHISAFLILSYERGTFAFNNEALIYGACGLGLLIGTHLFTSKIYKGGCTLIWNGVFFLSDTGLIMLWRLDKDLAQRQLIWFFAGFCAMLLLPLMLKLIPRFEKLEKAYFAAGLLLLLSTFVLGREEFGAINWIKIGAMSMQPSEIVKFLFVFYLASAFRKKMDIWHVLLICAVSASFVLILVLQTDLGGALIFFMTFMVIMYVSTGRELLFLLGMSAMSAASYIAYNIFNHVQVRVAIWQNPWADVRGTGHQIVQALFAIGTWGLFGAGLTKGFPGYVPVVSRDSIFAAICEEMGSVFGMGIIGVYIMIFYRGAHIALRCRRKYYSLLAVGFTAMMAFQTFLILGGTIKLIPLTGVTLPFVSYGGSSVLVSSMMIGILQWIFMHYSGAGSDKGGGGEL